MKASTRDNFYESTGILFEQITRDPAFENGSPLNRAATAAQTALGKVEQRLDSLRRAKTDNEKKVFSAELLKADADLDHAGIEFLRQCAQGVNGDSAVAALELLNSLPADLSKKHDLNSIKSALDVIILREKKNGAPKLDPKIKK